MRDIAPPEVREATASASTSEGAPVATTAERVASLDAFRGLAIAGMILVNNPGSWAQVYPPLRHAEWHGWTPTDLIFPYFLFILGAALPFSFARRMDGGARRTDLLLHIARRSAILVVLGLAMRAIPDFDFAEMRVAGVLQRIGLVYFAAAGLYVVASRERRWAIAPLLLLGYWALLAWVPVPGFGAGDLSPEGNLPAHLDRLLMPGRLWQDTWDPEGLLSTVPAVVTALLGVFTGEWLRSGAPGPKLARGMVGAGVALTALGWLWGLVFPINKNLWTSSYVLFTAGTALVLFSVLFHLIDVRGRRGAWERWMVVYGMNAIAIFVASGMVTKTLARLRVGDGDSARSAYGWIYEELFRSWAGDRPGSLAFAVTYVALWLGVAWFLHARRIYIKV